MKDKNLNRDLQNDSESFQKSFYETFGLYIGVGLQIVAATILGAWAGLKLDEKLATGPCFLLGGLVVGCAAGFFSMYRIISFYNSRRSKK